MTDINKSSVELSHHGRDLDAKSDAERNCVWGYNNVKQRIWKRYHEIGEMVIKPHQQWINWDPSAKIGNQGINSRPEGYGDANPGTW